MFDTSRLWRPLLVVMILVLVMPACGKSASPQATPTNTPAVAPTATPTATKTPTPEPTSTQTPISVPLADLEGLLFFDYSGSGLREDNEPPITNFRVCTQVPPWWEEVCVETGEDGRYVFEDLAPTGIRVHLSFVDPGAADPALAFRFINIWKGPVIIPAYVMSGVAVPEQHLNDVSQGTGARN